MNSCARWPVFLTVKVTLPDLASTVAGRILNSFSETATLWLGAAAEAPRAMPSATSAETATANPLLMASMVAGGHTQVAHTRPRRSPGDLERSLQGRVDRAVERVRPLLERDRG